MARQPQPNLPPLDNPSRQPLSLSHLQSRILLRTKATTSKGPEPSSTSPPHRRRILCASLLARLMQVSCRHLPQAMRTNHERIICLSYTPPSLPLPCLSPRRLVLSNKIILTEKASHRSQAQIARGGQSLLLLMWIQKLAACRWPSSSGDNKPSLFSILV
jgi:hypothetical protein